jgi:hypothetical protein
MMKKQNFSLFALALVCAATSVFAQIKPLPEVVEAREKWEEAVKAQAYVPQEFVFFRENFASGGYSYVYGGNTRIFIPEESGHIGEVAVVFELDPADYSGGAIVLWGTHFDLTDVFATGALEFWIKGTTSGKIGRVGLADDEMVDGLKTQVTVDFNRHGGIQPFWTHMSIPLSSLGRRGSYWDPRTQTLINNDFKWGNVKEFIVTTSKGANRQFKVWLDDIRIVPNRFPEPPNLWEPHWDERKPIIAPAPTRPGADVVEAEVLWTRDFRAPMRGVGYGGRTVWAQKNTTEPAGESPHVLAVYLDNTEFSGVTFNWGRSTDLTQLRANNGGLGFWVKGGSMGVTQLIIGLVDDRGNRSVTTAQVANDFGTIDTNWNYIMIPFPEFADEGSWWDESINRTRPGIVDWSRIVGMTVSSNRFVNRILIEDPINVFLSRIAYLESVPGYVDPNLRWDNFRSNAPDMMVTNFETTNDPGEWIVIRGASSMVQLHAIPQVVRNMRPRFGRWQMAIDWDLDDWAMANFKIGRRNLPYVSDWSRHSAVAFDAHSALPNGERWDVKIVDSGREEWVATINLQQGWQEVTVPFRNFRRAVNQPADAVVNKVLDLENVMEFGFNPMEILTSSRTIIDNLRVTQEPQDGRTTINKLNY